jgi:hypothetical protein
MKAKSKVSPTSFYYNDETDYLTIIVRPTQLLKHEVKPPKIESSSTKGLSKKRGSIYFLMNLYSRFASRPFKGLMNEFIFAASAKEPKTNDLKKLFARLIKTGLIDGKIELKHQLGFCACYYIKAKINKKGRELAKKLKEESDNGKN